ncbi:MAG: PAS domain S-box protein, partial [bacterium]|nr:PAS domain S-box protein [bacterium]
NVKFIFGFTKDEVEKLGKINLLLGKGLFKKKDLNDKGEIQNIERTVKDKKGKEHHVLVNVKKVNIKGGTILYSCRDITERKRTENALVESEQKHRSLYETMIQGVVYQNVDGAITSANSAAERILGLSIDQMQGRASIDPRWKAIHEDGSDFPGKAHPSMLSLRSGKEIRNVVMGVFNPESNTHRWINVNAVPQFKKGKSKPFQVYTTFEDITERRKIQELIVEKEKYYRSLLYNLHEDIIVIDKNFNIADLNQTFMESSGFDRDDIVGKHCFEISHGYDKPCDKYGNECYIKEVFKTG